MKNSSTNPAQSEESQRQESTIDTFSSFLPDELRLEVLTCYKNFKAGILDRVTQTKIEREIALAEKQDSSKQGSSLDSSIYYLDISGYNNPNTKINDTVLAEKITQKQGQLMFLNLAESELSSDDLNMIINTLDHENCKLISLALSSNTLNEDTINTLIEALSNPAYNAKDPKQ